METLLIAIVAAGASLLTFFSGFGLGTILLPILIFFYPLDLAVAMTALVHLFNGVFKAILMRSHAHKDVVLNFGIPALVFAFMGAMLLVYLSKFPVHVQYKLFHIPLSTSPVKVVIGLLLLVFAIIELIPVRKSEREVKPASLWVGGALSGFFGGLSGHQGALRSAFLIKLGLTKEAFIGTGILIALMIDLSRIPVYLKEFDRNAILSSWPVILAATLAAFAGAYVGSRLLKKVTLHLIKYVVAIGVGLIGLLLAFGVV